MLCVNISVICYIKFICRHLTTETQDAEGTCSVSRHFSTKDMDPADVSASAKSY